MAIIIRFTAPNGAVTYWPKGFGFDSHEHTANIADAERFEDRARAERSLRGYLFPPAFWNSERQHAERMRAKFRGWKCEVVKA